MQTYSDPTRADDPHALPDVEVFYMNDDACAFRDNGSGWETMTEPGWYYWYCFPGCLPDSDPIGPFDSAEAAKQAAQEDASC